MRFSKINSNVFSLGLIVDSEFAAWSNVIAFVVAQSDYVPISSTVYGQPLKAKDFRYEKILEVRAAGKCSYKIGCLFDCLTPRASFQRKAKLRTHDTSHFGFVFLSEFYSGPVIRYRSYANIARIQLHDLRSALQRTHLSLSVLGNV